MAVDGHALVLAEGTSTGDRLRLARIAAGLEQEEMAEAVDISVRSYQRTESGQRPARRVELVEFARLTGQDVSFFETSAAGGHKTVSRPGNVVKAGAS